MSKFGERKNTKTTVRKGFFASILPENKKEFFYFSAIILLLIFMVNPFRSIILDPKEQAVRAVASLAIVPEGETPIVDVIGGGNTLPGINEILNQNEVNVRIYGNAKDGDFVVGYSSKIIIYRPSDGSIVYDGPSPEAILNNERRNLITTIIRTAKEDGILAQASTEQPQLLLLDDVFINAVGQVGIYENARENDILATFFGSQVVVLFRPSENAVIDARRL